MGSFKSHSLKKNILQVVAVVCVQSAWETAKRTVWQPRCSLVFQRSAVVLMFFLIPQQNGFSVRYSVPRGDLVASRERTLHRYDRVTLQKVGFDGKWALLVGPHHLYDCGVL